MSGRRHNKKRTDTRKHSFKRSSHTVLSYYYVPINCNYASAAVMIAIEYTSEALHPRDRSLIGAFKPSKIGP